MNPAPSASLNVKSDAGASLIDAAHIIPFASSHNDAPRNGLALCRNHHWGFDASVFSISDDYRLILPRKGQTLEDYVRAGDKLKLAAGCQVGSGCRGAAVA